MDISFLLIIQSFKIVPMWIGYDILNIKVHLKLKSLHNYKLKGYLLL